MKLSRTPLDESTKTRLIAYYHEMAVRDGITPERALYNSSRVMGLTADDLDALYSMPAGSAQAWIDANKLPVLSGIPTMEPL